ncbi:ErfK/YbiS/YcfS/YnhG family protein [Sporocytophaga myxococcoides]|uniref:ErfK/YbiS/YcfS/YnhG family protein n=1 Tax=Sporocytophaga myxococcoides TaxID=153721 RepID=A0A098L8J6_9BACT|nr:L,D-transpeptidase family protein [Sporocytophaga myxococcoides]GAL83096.1 ErfK/YbiS/YcfS/YnhG family protein [Sporocytophaga myxococcoides]
MKILSIVFLLLFLNSCDSKKTTTFQRDYNDSVSFNILLPEQNKISDSDIKKFIKKHPEYQPYQKKLEKFYIRRNFQPAWSKDYKFIPQAQMLINYLNHMNKHGLKTDSANIMALKEAIKKSNETQWFRLKDKQETFINTDILLSASFFKDSKKIWRGHFKNDDLENLWKIKHKKIKYGRTLDSILSSGANDPFTEFEPLHKDYKELKAVLNKYTEIAGNGGWPEVTPQGKVLIKGDIDSEIIHLRKRLYLSGDISHFEDNKTFDQELEQAVKHFQYRHKLKEDGIVKGETLKEMNIPIEDRIEQISINMERWRWVPEEPSEKYILVNIPEFKMHVFEKNSEIYNMKVIVGKSGAYTPIFSDQIEKIVINPSWIVPAKIATTELVPMIKRDTSILSKQNIEIYTDYSFNTMVNPDTIDWLTLDTRKFNYVLKQKSNFYNPLGHIKFLFPNEYDIYLHDTPSDYLFEESERNFSHGCIRIEDPIWLASYLLKDEPQWNKKKLYEAIYRQEEKSILLKKKLPVFILYFTTWVDETGTIHFLKDIYDHDKQLKSILESKE